MKNSTVFCEMINKRSNEHRLALRKLSSLRDVFSPAMSILRQELDSMVRVIYLTDIVGDADRIRLIQSTLNGEKWKMGTSNGKLKPVTDSDMTKAAQSLRGCGWTESVYKFCCSFIHLSNSHNLNPEDPFDQLAESEKQNALKHMRSYHFGPKSDHPTMSELSEYIIPIFEKISSSLGSQLDKLGKMS